jgi:hypothetical protein
MYASNDADPFVIYGGANPNRYYPSGFNSLYKMVVRDIDNELTSFPVEIIVSGEYNTAPLNLGKQISLDEKGQVLLTFPIGLASTNYMFGSAWFDMLGNTSAGVAAMNNIFEVPMYSTPDGTATYNTYVGTVSNEGSIEGSRYWMLRDSIRGSKSTTSIPDISITTVKNRLLTYDLGTNELVTKGFRYVSVSKPIDAYLEYDLDLKGNLQYFPGLDFVGNTIAKYRVLDDTHFQSSEANLNFTIVDTYTLNLNLTWLDGTTVKPAVGVFVRVWVMLTKLHSFSITTGFDGVAIINDVPLGVLNIDTPAKAMLCEDGKLYSTINYHEDVSTVPNNIKSMSLDITPK